MLKKINLQEKFDSFKDHWTPKIIDELNDQYIKLAKVKGEFCWHDHAEEDELFIVHKGTLILEFRDHSAEIGPGEIFVVPKGVEHLPKTKDNEEVHLILIEPKETKHTGTVNHELTKQTLDWI